MDTLADYLAPDLHILSIGLNPSVNSVRAGFYFATPQNRFWRALNDSGLPARPVEPGPAAHEVLLRRDRIGFTDVVKRPTPGGSQLRAADFRRWAPDLRQRLLDCGARIAWFHGLQAYRAYLRYGEDDAPGARGEIPWGRQAHRIGASAVFVSPNPSPANAAYSLRAITQWYARLARWRDGLTAAQA